MKISLCNGGCARRFSCKYAIKYKNIMPKDNNNYIECDKYEKRKLLNQKVD